MMLTFPFMNRGLASDLPCDRSCRIAAALSQLIRCFKELQGVAVRLIMFFGSENLFSDILLHTSMAGNGCR